MKKLSTIITAAVLAFGTLTATSISAAACCRRSANARGNYGTNTSAVSTAQSRALHYFIDCNFDGICDCLGGVCLSSGLCSGYFHEHGVFIDSNNDGICDNYAAGVCTQHGNHHMGGNFIDENNDGICDNCADGVCTQHGYHHISGNFIDENNDGICDNCADGVCTQHGYHHISGNYIDENNDGICDNCAAGVCTQHGVGLSHHNGHGCHR